MIGCKRPFQIVITSNNGYPLDQNLYQSVKGMSAAAQIVEEDGLILFASECSDGFPDHGSYRKLLFDYPSPEALLDTIRQPGFSMFDQWQVQLQALICTKACVGIFSKLEANEVRKAHLTPVKSLQDSLEIELDRVGSDATVALLPEGPLTVPYLL